MALRDQEWSGEAEIVGWLGWQVGRNCSPNGLTWCAPAGNDSKKRGKKKHLKEAMKES